MNDELKSSKKVNKIYFDRLFPKMNGINLNNMLIDYDSISFITVPVESKKISDIISRHLSKYISPKNATMVDATAGVGGDTFSFANDFQNVISIELNSDRCELLKHNVNQYDYKNVTILNGDSTIIIPKLNIIDTIYVDPPWGGKEYKLKDNLRLSIGSLTIEDFIINCFNKDITNCFPKVVALKLPKNYDIKFLFEKLSEKFDIYMYQLKKINVFLIEEHMQKI